MNTRRISLKRGKNMVDALIILGFTWIRSLVYIIFNKKAHIFEIICSTAGSNLHGPAAGLMTLGGLLGYLVTISITWFRYTLGWFKQIIILHLTNIIDTLNYRFRLRYIGQCGLKKHWLVMGLFSRDNGTCPWKRGIIRLSNSRCCPFNHSTVKLSCGENGKKNNRLHTDTYS